MKKFFNIQGRSFFVPYVIVFLLLVMGCNHQDKIQQQEDQLKEKVRNVSENIYVPVDAILLFQKDQIDSVHYAKGCHGIEVTRVYGVNRSFQEIREDYEEKMPDFGWVYISPPNDRVFSFLNFRRDETTELFITPDLPDSIDMEEIEGYNDFNTLYYLYLYIVEPSYGKCVG